VAEELPILLTADELAAIRERLERATPGPWTVFSRDGVFDPRDDDADDVFMGYGIDEVPVPDRGQFARPSDARFAAAARQDVPALLSHIAAQRATIAALWAHIDNMTAATASGLDIAREEQTDAGGA